MTKTPLTIKRLLSDSIVYGSARFISAIISIFLIPIYTRYFSVEQYGIIETLNIFHLILFNLFSLGLGQAIFRYYATSNDADEKKKVFSTIHYASLFFSGIVMLAFGLLLSNWFGHRFVKLGDKDNFILILLVLLQTICVINSTNFQSILSINFKKIDFIISTIGVVFFSSLLSIIFIVVFHYGIISVFLASTIANFICTIYAYIKVRKEISTQHFSFSLLFKFISFCLPFIPITFSILIMRSSDRYFMSLLLDNSLYKIGLYSTAEKVVMPLTMIGAAFQLAWEPIAMKAAGESDPKPLYKSAFKYYISITTIACIIFCGLAKFVLLVLTTEPYFIAYKYVAPLGIYLSFNSLIVIGSKGILLTNKQKMLSLFVVIAALINLLLNYITIPIWEIYGSAWSTVVSLFILNILIFIYAEQKYYVGYPLISGLILYIISSIVSIIIVNNIVWGGILLFLYTIMLFKLNFLELKPILNFINSLKNKSGLIKK